MVLQKVAQLQREFCSGTKAELLFWSRDESTWKLTPLACCAASLEGPWASLCLDVLSEHTNRK